MGPRNEDDPQAHPSPCPPLVWFRAAVLAAALFAFGLASSIAGILWSGSAESAKRITAAETTAAALAARVDERLRAIEASQARMERTLDILVSRPAPTALGLKGATP